FAPSPDGTGLAAGSAAVVLLFEADGARRPALLKGHTDSVRALAYGQSAKRLYSAGPDNTIILWEAGRFWGDSQRAVYRGHTDPIVGLAVTPDGSLVASASLDGTIRLWDASGDSTDAVATLVGHSGSVRLVRFTGQGTLLLSAGDGGQVFLWEVTDQ